MYVNISPADYNLEETLTSLAYAARVKLITNDAAKNEESKEVHRLKAEFQQRTGRPPMGNGSNCVVKLRERITKLK